MNNLAIAPLESATHSLEETATHCVDSDMNAVLEYNLLVVQSYGEGGARALLPSDLPALITWCQENEAALLNFLSTTEYVGPYLPWTGSEIDFTDYLGQLSGLLTGQITGGGGFGSAFGGNTKGDTTSIQAIVTIAAFKWLPPFQYSVDTFQWGAYSVEGSSTPGNSSSIGLDLGNVVPLTTARDWVLVPVPNYDASQLYPSQNVPFFVNKFCGAMNVVFIPALQSGPL